MSSIEYNSLLFEVSERLNQRYASEQLLFMCRGYLASGTEDNIKTVLSLFKELENQNRLEIDRLEVLKEILKVIKEWSLIEKVEKFEIKRKEYNCLRERVSLGLDELNDLERLVLICRGKISEESEGNIHDVRTLLKELERQNYLGVGCLDFLKEILTETEKEDLLKEVQDFEKRRHEEDEFERREGKVCFVFSKSLQGEVTCISFFKSYNIHLITGPKGNSFVFLRSLMFPETKLRSIRGKTKL